MEWQISSLHTIRTILRSTWKASRFSISRSLGSVYDETNSMPRNMFVARIEHFANFLKECKWLVSNTWNIWSARNLCQSQYVLTLQCTRGLMSCVVIYTLRCKQMLCDTSISIILIVGKERKPCYTLRMCQTTLYFFGLVFENFETYRTLQSIIAGFVQYTFRVRYRVIMMSQINIQSRATFPVYPLYVNIEQHHSICDNLLLLINFVSHVSLLRRL